MIGNRKFSHGLTPYCTDSVNFERNIFCNLSNLTTKLIKPYEQKCIFLEAWFKVLVERLPSDNVAFFTKDQNISKLDLYDEKRLDLFWFSDTDC